jgi:hypothetical protein
LNEELLAANRLSFFADHASVDGQALEALEETMVRIVLPSHEPRTSPAARTQLVEATVVSDTKCHVGIDTRLAGAAECCPGVEAGRMLRDDGGDCISPLVGCGSECLLQLVRDGDIDWRKHRLWRTAAGH